MAFEGEMRDGVVVLDAPIPLPDGTRVTVQPAAADAAPADATPSNGKPKREYPSYVTPEIIQFLEDAENDVPVPDDVPSLYEQMKPHIEAAEARGGRNLPPDASQNIDHYRRERSRPTT